MAQNWVMMQVMPYQLPVILKHQIQVDLPAKFVNLVGLLAYTQDTESGVDEQVEQKFPGANVIYGSAASGAGDNREIPLSEGGDLNPRTGK